MSMKWMTIVAAVVVIVVVVGIALARRFSMFDCHDTVKEDVISADGKFAAAVVERDCGATTPYSTLVFVRRAGVPIDPKGPSPVFVVKGRNDVRVQWRTPASLTVSYAPGEIFKREVSYDAVQLSYAERSVR